MSWFPLQGQRPAYTLNVVDEVCLDGSQCPVWPDSCVSCEADLPDVHRGQCPAGHPIEFPNLVDACRREQRKAVTIAFDMGTHGWTQNSKTLWRTFMLGSTAVLSCHSELLLSVLWNISTFPNYHDVVANGSRVPDGPDWDYPRNIVDEALFPGYKDKIRFAALSLDGRGVRRYGECFIELRDDVLKRKGSLFSENSFFARQNDGTINYHDHLAGKKAAWLHRDYLAVAKLGPHIGEVATVSTIAPVLLADGDLPPDDAFIEVHVYGPIGLDAISKVSIPSNERRRQYIEEECERNRIRCDVRP